MPDLAGGGIIGSVYQPALAPTSIAYQPGRVPWAEAMAVAARVRWRLAMALASAEAEAARVRKRLARAMAGAMAEGARVRKRLARAMASAVAEADRRRCVD